MPSKSQIDRDATICARRKAGATIKQLAHDFDLHTREITRILFAGRVPTRNSAERAAKREAIMADYLEGLPVKVIAYKHGVSRSMVSYLAAAQGFEFMTARRRNLHARKTARRAANETEARV